MYHGRQSHTLALESDSIPAQTQLNKELEQLVEEHIRVFKELKVMSDRDILEFLLRSLRIRALFKARDRQVRSDFLAEAAV